MNRSTSSEPRDAIDDDDLLATLPAPVSRALATFSHAFAATVAAAPNATLRPNSDGVATLDGSAEAALASMPLGDALEIGATLGEGGMGVVRLGRQRALGRAVAVKTLRDDARASDAGRLLREAWISATLEHPNIVPVYELGTGADGRPVLVLRLVEGSSWAQVLDDPEALAARLTAGTDALEWNLRVLAQVCDAVGLAHARGILHRDIKPDNVMLGRHGEVYLLDWGIAATLEPDPSGRLPCVRDAAEVVGTPCYMPPELLQTDVARMGPALDVYLLGATLYELVAGRPPHAGDGFAAIATSILFGPPRLEEPEVPSELAAIVHRAMALEPGDRHPSARALRDALLTFLAHRHSVAVARDAGRALRELEALAREESPERARVYATLGEARFGFRQALSEWSENAEAQRGLAQAVRVGVELELRLGQNQAAASLLAELTDPPADLEARVHDALAREKEERQRNERLARDHDPAIGRRTRIVMQLVFASCWILGPFAGMALQNAGWPATKLVGGFGLVQFALAMAFAAWARDALLGSKNNRRWLGVGAGMALFQTMLCVVIDRLGAGDRVLFACVAAHWSFAAFVAGAMLSRPWFVYSAAMALALVASLSSPSSTWLFLAGANLSTLLFPALEWRKIRTS